MLVIEPIIATLVRKGKNVMDQWVTKGSGREDGGMLSRGRGGWIHSLDDTRFDSPRGFRLWIDFYQI